jgi:hypothetical protein
VKDWYTPPALHTLFVDRNATQSNEGKHLGISETFQPVLNLFRLAEPLRLPTMDSQESPVFWQNRHS